MSGLTPLLALALALLLAVGVCLMKNKVYSTVFVLYSKPEICWLMPITKSQVYSLRPAGCATSRFSPSRRCEQSPQRCSDLSD